jgi:hypothetical protein
VSEHGRLAAWGAFDHDWAISQLLHSRVRNSRPASWLSPKTQSGHFVVSSLDKENGLVSGAGNNILSRIVARLAGTSSASDENSPALRLKGRNRSH